MAKQLSVHPLVGTIDEMNYYKDPVHGYLARKATDVDRKDVLKKPYFKYFLYNAAEFKRAFTDGKLLRRALHDALWPVADPLLSSRMNTVFLEVIKSDPLSGWGERKTANGQIKLLEGFDFNSFSLLANTFTAPYTISASITKAQTTVDLPAFVPLKHIIVPEGAKYFQVLSIVASLDFEQGSFVENEQRTTVLPLNKEMTDAIHLEHLIQPLPGQYFFHALGIVFYGLLQDVPVGALSKRKRKRLKQLNKNRVTAFTGALRLFCAEQVPAADVQVAPANDSSQWWSWE